MKLKRREGEKEGRRITPFLHCEKIQDKCENVNLTSSALNK